MPELYRNEAQVLGGEQEAKEIVHTTDFFTSNKLDEPRSSETRVIFSKGDCDELPVNLHQSGVSDSDLSVHDKVLGEMVATSSQCTLKTPKKSTEVTHAAPKYDVWPIHSRELDVPTLDGRDA